MLLILANWGGQVIESNRTVQLRYELQQERIDFEKYKITENALIIYGTNQNLVWERSNKLAGRGFR